MTINIQYVHMAKSDAMDEYVTTRAELLAEEANVENVGV